MKNWPFWIGCLAAIVVIILYLQFFRTDQPEPVSIPAPAVQPAAPQPTHPIEEATVDVGTTEPIIDASQPLPELQQSDKTVGEVLERLFSEQNLGRFFLLEHIIERFVVMVDNLPRQDLPVSHRPLKKISGKFLVQKKAGELTIASANYDRYTPVIRLLEKADAQQVVTVYATFYPLFQEAYAALGYPDRYFNDRLIEVIDHLLQTPIVQDPVRLIQPKALYLFADPALEDFSAGRKVLIRIGSGNAERIKQILRVYRKQLVAAEVAN